MLLGLKSKESVLEGAKTAHRLRERAMEAYVDFLKLDKPHLQAVRCSIFPATTLSNTFCYDSFKSSLQTGSYGDVFYTQIDPVPLTCPLLKQLSELLDSKISTISSFKYTEDHSQARFSSHLKENLENQVQK